MVEQTVGMASEAELEEVVIPEEDNRTDDDELDDVVPCEYVAVEGQTDMAYDMAGSSNEGLYNDAGYYTPSVSVDQMVDIAPQVVQSSGYELEEIEIPEEDNSPDDDQLDDVA